MIIIKGEFPFSIKREGKRFSRMGSYQTKNEAVEAQKKMKKRGYFTRLVKQDPPIEIFRYAIYGVINLVKEEKKYKEMKERNDKLLKEARDIDRKAKAKQRRIAKKSTK